MTKKTSRRKRRQRKPNVPQYTVPVEKTAEDVEVKAPDRTSQASSPRRAVGESSGSVDWPAEYPFVLGDLRSMALVTLLMLAILFVANLLVT
ncbi:MAG: hypothetical protein D6791_16925 [Chloroflexi bacterium]|nr:MAG: hypothetical protein D6791_16925 [Chloroflexota bacterium]